jgi:hypothetical protein
MGNHIFCVSRPKCSVRLKNEFLGIILSNFFSFFIRVNTNVFVAILSWVFFLVLFHIWYFVTLLINWVHRFTLLRRFSRCRIFDERILINILIFFLPWSREHILRQLDVFTYFYLLLLLLVVIFQNMIDGVLHDWFDQVFELILINYVTFFFDHFHEIWIFALNVFSQLSYSRDRFLRQHFIFIDFNLRLLWLILLLYLHTLTLSIIIIAWQLTYLLTAIDTTIDLRILLWLLLLLFLSTIFLKLIELIRLLSLNDCFLR